MVLEANYMSSFHQIQKFLEQLKLSSYDINLIDAYIGSNQLKLSSYTLSFIDSDIGSNKLFEEAFRDLLVNNIPIKFCQVFNMVRIICTLFLCKSLNDNFYYEEESIIEKKILHKIQRFLEQLKLNYNELNFIDTYIEPNKTYREVLYEYLSRQEQDSIRNILSWFPETFGVRIGLDAPTFKIKREAIFLANTLFNQFEDLDIEIYEILEPFLIKEASTEQRILAVFAAAILIRAGDWLDE